MADLIQSISNYFPSDSLESQAGRDTDALVRFFALNSNASKEKGQQVERRVNQLSDAFHPNKYWMEAYIALDEKSCTEENIKPVIHRLAEEMMAFYPPKETDEGLGLSKLLSFFMFYTFKMKKYVSDSRIFEQCLEEFTKRCPAYSLPRGVCFFLKSYDTLRPRDIDVVKFFDVFCDAYSNQLNDLKELDGVFEQFYQLDSKLSREMPWSKPVVLDKSISNEILKVLDDAWELIQRSKELSLLLFYARGRFGLLNNPFDLFIANLEQVNRVLVWQNLMDDGALSNAAKDKEMCIQFLIQFSRVYPASRAVHYSDSNVPLDVLKDRSLLLKKMNKKEFLYADALSFILDCRTSDSMAELEKRVPGGDIKVFAENLCRSAELPCELLFYIASVRSRKSEVCKYFREVLRKTSFAFLVEGIESVSVTGNPVFSADVIKQISALTKDTPDWAKLFIIQGLNASEKDLEEKSLNGLKNMLDSSTMPPVLVGMNRFIWAKWHIQKSLGMKG